MPLRQLPLRLQLGADEADRDDAVLGGRAQEPRPRLVPCGLVLEDDLVEPRERVPDMWGVVDRQAAPALRIDVGKRAVGQAGALFRVERHQVMIAKRPQPAERARPPRMVAVLTNRSAPPATVTPVLAYPDVRAAVEWLAAAFGFEERVRIGDSHRAQLRVGSDGAVVVAEGSSSPTLPRS